MAFTGQVQYEKLYVDIWATEAKAKKLRSNAEVSGERIKVWTLKELFLKIFEAIRAWSPPYESKCGEATLPESYWMLKLLESLREWKLLNIDVAA